MTNSGNLAESMPSSFLEPFETAAADAATIAAAAATTSATAATAAPSRARVLSIEGSDPIGGAGTMADMKVFTAHGVYGYAVMTSVLAQNTQGVTDIVNMDPAFIRAQLDSVSTDSAIDSMKIGMLGTVEIIDVVRSWLQELLDAASRGEVRRPFVVIDPVMYAKSSDALLTPDAEKALRTVLPMADIITPNIPELAALSGADEAASTWDQMVEQATDVVRQLSVGVYATSGMLALQGAADASDALVLPAASAPASAPVSVPAPALTVPGGETEEGHSPEPTVIRIPGAAIPTVNVHGTGDSLSSSLAALRPQKTSWKETAVAAKRWITGAIRSADKLQVGKGHGPIDFTWQKAPTAMSFSSDYWNRVKPVRDRISSMPFIVALIDGSLPLENFAKYLHQDDLYLRDYTSLLALAASRADDISERVFFAQGAERGVEAELQLHRNWFLGNGFDPALAPMSETTANYLGHEHLVADQGLYSTLAAVVMPCYWLYAEIGKQIAHAALSLNLDLEAHPYGPWIKAYSSTAFDGYVARELEICNRLAGSAGIEEYGAMMDAALISSEHEYRFFAQGLEG
ncbi:MAG: bifunctional hydroxymethylpyrimidine kinase/phosphomethylpyrimidine kinase [Bifidobacteriaceae bacterium]|jgi:hydroxymethylpyrimidine kinase/phosphomethylpyrimidine kinase|nr:bifunctional hydroxymethylpyrimidine kinase/phosphomethylpyrimidine kinase [Bifidobacteriaceae bacterium]MCI1978926.1 bifunctional hydroxymethylpyrimidine kinase/phosphomethylpyrimidine kinase [Bifidobacteriaceae bacterium]